jgi:hypothetical protein
MNWKTEAALCEAFGTWARAHDYETDNEALGWDMLLIDQSGRRCGVQAKLKDAMEAVAQCLEGMQTMTVDVAAVLMPCVSQSMRRMLAAAGLGWFVPVSEDKDGFVSFEMRLPKHRAQGELKALPPRKNQTPAGVKSPRKFTRWTEKELRLEVIFHRRGGWVNTKDCKSVGIDPRSRYGLPSWLYRERANHFSQVAGSDLPSKHHPTNYKAVEKEMERPSMLARMR